MQIHTKFHKLMELLETDEIYFTAASGNNAEHYTDYNVKIDEIRQNIKEILEVPKFVFDNELIGLAVADEFCKSMYDMKTAELLHLPFNSVLVEFNGSLDFKNENWPLTRKGTLDRAFVMLSDTFANMLGSDVMGTVISINEDYRGQYLVASPSIITIELEFNKEKGPYLKMTGVPNPWFHNYEKANQLTGKTFQKDANYIAIAWFLVLLMMTTKGVEKEMIEPVKLNKQRTKQGKVSIPKHIYLKIGHVYQKDGTALKYDSRKSPRPHWRRGHLHKFRYGKGRTEVKEMFVRPMLVAYHGDEIKDEIIKDYNVTM